jgi:hypothetical protein
MVSFRRMNLLGIAAATTLIIGCTLLPFLPGSYDGLAVPLSAMARIVGTFGLVLVPAGTLWLATDRSARLARWQVLSTVLLVIAASLTAALMVVIAAIQSGVVLAVVVLALASYGMRCAWTMARRQRGQGDMRHRVIPLYLTVVPFASAVLQLALIERATESSRQRAMRNAAPLIASIEHYRAANGHYPVSLLSVWRDYSPGVIGIERYHYEPRFDAYDLVFEQFTHRFGTREFVVYNPRDQQAVTAHVFDLLELTPEQLALEQQRGHYEEAPAGIPHWKLFRFD